MNSWLNLLEPALQRRQNLIERLHQENTDCYRLFHGIAEGFAGLTIDRYGHILLVQTFSEPLSQELISKLEGDLKALIQQYIPQWQTIYFVYNHRGQNHDRSFDYWHKPEQAALLPQIIHESGMRFVFYARHRGKDPLLFLDLRKARRFVLQNCQNMSVLNLFAYTCGVGIYALKGQAKQVWNIDFSAGALEYGKKNYQENGNSEGFYLIQEDVFCALYQLAKQPIKGKRARHTIHTKLQPQQFDLVFLDPPAWSKSPYGAVDLIHDYQSLFKPCLWVTKSGGKIIAVNNVAQVDRDDWIEKLQRCAIKAGFALGNITILHPDEDFPSWDQLPPLKIAVCEVLK